MNASWWVTYWLAIKCKPYRVNFGRVFGRECKPPKKKAQVNQSLRLILGGDGGIRTLDEALHPILP